MKRLLILSCLAVASAMPAPALADGATIFMATWRGCEEACQGFIDYIDALGQDIEVSIRDAGQDTAALAQISAEARSSGADLIVSWGTSMTQAIAGTVKDLGNPDFNHDIPQVFMIVADPVGSGIILSLDDPGRPNITGTYNRMPETVTIASARRLLPEFTKLGLLYNENEPNSVIKRDELAELAAAAGYELVALAFPLDASGLPQPEDIGPMTRKLKDAGAEILYVGSSSFLRANGALLGSAAKAAKLPVISPYEDLVRDGHALLSIAARYYDVGRLAGEQAKAILVDGVPAGDMPVARMTDFAIMVNLGVAKEIDLWPPIDLLQIAEVVQ